MIPGDSNLKMLEGRKSEREAQAFVKLRRQRERKSQETWRGKRRKNVHTGSLNDHLYDHRFVFIWTCSCVCVHLYILQCRCFSCSQNIIFPTLVPKFGSWNFTALNVSMIFFQWVMKFPSVITSSTSCSRSGSFYSVLCTHPCWLLLNSSLARWEKTRQHTGHTKQEHCYSRNQFSTMSEWIVLI